MSAREHYAVKFNEAPPDDRDFGINDSDNDSDNEVTRQEVTRQKMVQADVSEWAPHAGNLGPRFLESLLDKDFAYKYTNRATALFVTLDLNDGGSATLEALITKIPMRRQGNGQKVLDYAAAHLRQLGLQTLKGHATNEAACVATRDSAFLPCM